MTSEFVLVDQSILRFQILLMKERFERAKLCINAFLESNSGIDDKELIRALWECQQGLDVPTTLKSSGVEVITKDYGRQ